MALHDPASALHAQAFRTSLNHVIFIPILLVIGLL
jgi:hypothetical protein